MEVPSYDILHVIPIGDNPIHVASTDRCWCRPRLDDSGERVYVHHAQDEREALEAHTGEGCSDGWLLVAEAAL